MEQLIKFAIFLYISLHGLDLSTALIFRDNQREEFDKSEDNIWFKKFLDRFPMPKAIFLYEITYELQYFVMFALSILFTFRIVMGEWNLALSIPFILISRALFHGLGTLTNTYMIIKLADTWEK